MEYDKKIALIKAGDEVQGFFLLKDASVKQAASGRPYLSGKLADASGEADFKFWDYAGTLENEDCPVVKARVKAEQYRGQIQLNVEKIRIATAEDSYSLNDLVPTAPIDSFAELEYIHQLVETIEDEDYRMICERMLDKHIVSFAKIPAAKMMHHSFLSGLLMHTANMLRIADYLSGIYPDAVDRSLLLAGTLLHDICKDKEYSCSQFGLIKDMTVEGMLIGHLVMGAEEVGDIGRSLGISAEKVMLLKHMILSHHGQPEYGAAVKPCIAESEMLAYIDMLDSRMEMYAESFEKTNVGTFSEKNVPGLDKKIYNHE